MATDVASSWVLDELEDGKPAPKASPMKSIVPDAGGFVSILVLDMDSYAEKYGDKAVRKILILCHSQNLAAIYLLMPEFLSMH